MTVGARRASDGAGYPVKRNNQPYCRREVSNWRRCVGLKRSEALSMPGGLLNQVKTAPFHSHRTWSRSFSFILFQVRGVYPNRLLDLYPSVPVLPAPGPVLSEISSMNLPGVSTRDIPSFSPERGPISISSGVLEPPHIALYPSASSDPRQDARTPPLRVKIENLAQLERPSFSK